MHPGRVLFAALLLVLTAGGEVCAAGLLTAQRLDNDAVHEIHARPARRLQTALLELVDPKTGRCLRVLYAGRMDQIRYLRLADDGSIPAGTYHLRYREGLSLELDGIVKRPVGPDPENADGGGWVNPVDLAFAGDKLTVFDAGKAVTPLEPAEERRWHLPNDQWVTARYVSRDAEGVTATLTSSDGQSVTAPIAELPKEDRDAIEQYEARRAAWIDHRLHTAWPALVRVNRDGTPDATFGEGGWSKVAETDTAWALRTMAVDETGTIFMGSGGHDAMSFTPDGKRTPQTIGGWDGDPHGPKCTPWVNSTAVGPNNRLYLPNGYGNMKVYDRTKNAFDGLLYSTKLAGGSHGHARAAACDRITGVVYVINPSHVVERYVDDGAAIAFAYSATVNYRTPNATGPCASGGLIWLAVHGPGFGPYWDSEGGGEVLLLWDNGQAISLVDRFGFLGVQADELAFLNASAVTMDPEHQTVWIAEDGLANVSGPPGNARVRRFKLEAVHTEELPIEMKGKP